MTAPMQTGELAERLRRHYIKPSEALPGGIFVEEVGINGGGGTRADAVYVGFTTASGRVMVGHEIKVSKSDWRNEREHIGKADFWADACHQWYVVAPSTDIVPLEEVPSCWGLMVVDPKTKVRLKVLQKPDPKPGHIPPWSAVRSVMSRYDTLRAGAIAKGLSDIQREHQNKITEIMGQQTVHHQARLDSEFTRLEALMQEIRRRGGYNARATDEEIITACIDLAAVRERAEQVRHRAQSMYREMVRIAEPFKHINGDLAQLIREFDRPLGATEAPTHQGV